MCGFGIGYLGYVFVLIGVSVCWLLLGLEVIVEDFCCWMCKYLCLKFVVFCFVGCLFSSVLVDEFSGLVIV